MKIKGAIEDLKVHFPGLSHSGSGSQVLPKDTDLVGPWFCVLPRP